MSSKDDDRSRSRSVKRINNPTSAKYIISTEGCSETRERSMSNCNRPKCPGYGD